MTNKYRLILIFLSLLFLSSCVPQHTKTENHSAEVDDKATIYPTDIPPSNEITSPVETEVITTTLVVPTTEPQDEGKYTYYLDQDRMDQFCLSFPQLQIFKPRKVGDYYIAYVEEQNNISSISIKEGTLTSLHVSEFPGGRLHPNEFEYPWYTYSVTDSP